MKQKLGEWIGKARRLESAISARVDGATRHLGGSPIRQPLETMHDVVTIIEREVQPAGRGSHVFPFTHVRIWLVAASAKDKARMEVACGGPPPLDDRIRARLSVAGCDVTELSIKVSYVAKARGDWSRPDFHVDFVRELAVPATVASPPRAGQLDLTITHGTAEHEHYTLTTGVCTLGRGREVRDTRERLLRTNQVAFAEDGSDVNLSVSRRHAHIVREEVSDAFRLHGDAGAQETRVIRDGRAVPVPRGRGLRLRTGDEIVLGQARLLVDIPKGASPSGG